MISFLTLKNLNIIEDVENLINNADNSANWEDGKVGYQDTLKNYRDCKDFKLDFIKTPKNEFEEKYTKVWHNAYQAQMPAVYDYCSFHNIKMEYWELMNFIKYVPGQHFQEHADHGWSYVCTVSLVAYPNDDYEGGELYFPKLGVKIKPKAEDLYIFPSTYLFSHVAMPVTSGTKYSVVTMLDYNENAHTPAFHNGRHD